MTPSKPARARPRTIRPPSPEFPIEFAMETLRTAVRQWPTPVVTVYAERRASPFEILVSTILSLRTQDRTTAEASARLFERARTPETLLKLRRETIERLIYPVGFYKTKARTLREISRRLLAEHRGRVPDTVEALVELKGVGRKTANLVVTLGYGKPGICVDTHVHRICNRWGYLRTNSPDETEQVLRRTLPERYWIPINDWLVAFGQNLCKPVSPLCSTCPLNGVCPKHGVGKSR